MRNKNHRIFCSPLLFIMAIVFLAAGCKRSGNPDIVNAFKRYPIERFHAVFQFSGDLRGTEEVFVSDYGKNEARYSKFEAFVPEGIKQRSNVTITRLGDTYGYNFLDSSFIKEHVPVLDSLYHLDNKDIPSPVNFMESEMKRQLLQLAGTDTIDGKIAERWHAPEGTMTIWVWNSIIIKKHVISPNAMMNLVMKSIDTLWTVDTTKFSHPVGFTKKDKPDYAPGPN